MTSPDTGRFAFVTLADAFYEAYDVPPLPLPFTPAQIATLLPEGNVPFSVVADNLASFIEEFPQARGVYAPLMARVSFEAGIFEGREGRFAAARDYLRHAVQCAPDNLTVRGNLARAYLDLHDDEAALTEFTAVRGDLTAEGFLPDVWLGGLTVLDRLGRGAERDEWAQDYIRRVARFFPEREAELFAHAASWAKEMALSEVVTQYLAGHREA